MVRRGKAASLWILFVVALDASGACLQVSGLDKITLDGGAPVPCNAATPCNDMNPCTTDACGSAGTCAFTPVPDGPASMQTPGNCQKIVCSAGQPHDEPDDTNMPTSTNPCVVVGCNAGVPTQDTTSKDMAPCTDNGRAGTCADGMCEIPCKAATDCSPTQPNPCVTPSCDMATGFCVFTPVPDGPASMQTAGGCEEATCTAGVLGQTPSAADTPCTTFMGTEQGHCDGMGLCRECTMDSECTGGTTTACQHPSCSTYVCGTTLVPNGTPTAMQVAGDCQQIVCDGMGGTMMVPDPSDAPTSTACATYACNGGTLVTTPHAGMACGSGQTCNAMGQCGCTTNADCTLYICQSGACLTSCTGDGQCATGAFCVGGACTPPQGNGMGCHAANECTSGFCVDGVCCNMPCNGKCQGCTAMLTGGTNGTCGPVPADQPDPTNQCMSSASTTCGFDGKCNGMGDCARWTAGTPCSATQCSIDTLTTYTQCDGVGTCQKGSMTSPCAGNFACSSTTSCATACGTTPYADGLCASNAYCDGSGNGFCELRMDAGAPCNSDDQCVDGLCQAFCN